MCEILSNSHMSHPLNKLTDECVSLTCSLYGLHRKESEVNITIIARRAFISENRRFFLQNYAWCIVLFSGNFIINAGSERAFLIWSLTWICLFKKLSIKYIKFITFSFFSSLSYFTMPDITSFLKWKWFYVESCMIPRSPRPPPLLSFITLLVLDLWISYFHCEKVKFCLGWIMIISPSKVFKGLLSIYKVETLLKRC